MPRSRAAVLLALTLALGWLPGCAANARRVTGWLGLGTRYEGGITREELQQGLLLLGTRFVVGVTAATDAITASVTPREINRRALLWKVRVVPLVQRATSLADPQESFVGLLTLAIAQRQYLSDGAGATLFEDQQAVAVETARAIEEDALALGARFLSPKALEAVRWQVEELVWRNPIRGVFLFETIIEAYRTTDSSGAFDWVIAIPLSPFRALEGVDAGAQAIREFNITAQQFADLVGRLPERLRWESELLLYDVESRETMRSITDSLAAVGESAMRLSESAARLPADVRAESQALLAELDARHGSLQRILADARAGLADLDAGLGKANELALQLDRVGVTWQGVASTLRGPEGEREGRPFDITEYERTAARIESASNAVRELAVELRASGDALGGALNGVLWRLVVLAAAVFALRLAFRRLEARLARRGDGRA